MARSKSLYDRLQYDLVIRSEKPHEFGLRDKPISGDICNRILTDFLRAEFPHFRFNSGIITKAERRPSRYEHSSSDLSAQADVIAYLGSPYEQIYDYVVVPLRHVKFVIETKKWIAPTGLTKEQGNVKRLKEFTGRPVFLVAFRHDGDLARLREKSAADFLFAFSTRSPGGGYPDYVKNFESKQLVGGQLLDLCKRIEALLN